ncbi:hypothetical protein MNBD_GAMMA12-2285 [hydrothermal vent metagenome]|uniref:Uncharacterized protein n=1 Tax=hydrothermal vent metagenome TaxID=652676 RepID=A0A3B0Y4G4_9ZZZZ
MQHIKKIALPFFIITFLFNLSACASPPNSAMGYNNQGASYAKSGRYDMALKYFNKALEIKPEFAGAYYNKGLAYGHKRMFSKAIKQFDRAIGINPNYADALDSRGLLYLITGKNKNKACADLKKACDLGVCKAFNMAEQKGDCS